MHSDVSRLSWALFQFSCVFFCLTYHGDDTTSEKQSNEPQSLCQKVNQCIIDNLSLRIEAPAVPVPIPKEAALTCDWSQQVAATAAASFISAKIQFL